MISLSLDFLDITDVGATMLPSRVGFGRGTYCVAVVCDRIVLALIVSAGSENLPSGATSVGSCALRPGTLWPWLTSKSSPWMESASTTPIFFRWRCRYINSRRLREFASAKRLDKGVSRSGYRAVIRCRQYRLNRRDKSLLNSSFSTKDCAFEAAVRIDGLLIA